jgi:hydroxymethylpyrimidine pyrophosphatase-like HAD family hydrolase
VYFAALATDYDETIAHSGIVDAATLEALKRVKESRRWLILVTGRRLSDLLDVFPDLDLFDLAVVENGAVLFDPAKNEEILLADPPPEAFLRRLRRSGVSPLVVGRSIVATRQPNETVVLRVIKELELELQVIFNKGAVMVLPSNVNKASGLRAALSRLGLAAHNVVGIGDAENDHAFLADCGFAVAVHNAVPAVKEKADLVIGPCGEGLAQLATLLCDDDLYLRELSARKSR